MTKTTTLFPLCFDAIILCCCHWSGSEAFGVVAPARRQQQQQKSHNIVALQASQNSRREFLSEQVVAAAAAAAVAAASSSSLVFSSPLPASANSNDPSDLTSQLFNEDGSLKEGVESKAKFSTVSIDWDVPSAEKSAVAVAVDADVVVVSSDTATAANNKMRVSYLLPQKWEKKNGILLDKSEQSNVQSKVLDHIYVYRSPKKATKDTLRKATTIGVPKALDVIDELNTLRSADLLSGRTEERNDQLYYNFDMAVAPKDCGSSAENLGLGFCPYDKICLLSATILDDFLYVFALECDKSEWKAFNSDLKGVRSSFRVDSLLAQESEELFYRKSEEVAATT